MNGCTDPLISLSSQVNVPCTMQGCLPLGNGCVLAARNFCPRSIFQLPAHTGFCTSLWTRHFELVCSQNDYSPLLHLTWSLCTSAFLFILSSCRFQVSLGSSNLTSVSMEKYIYLYFKHFYIKGNPFFIRGATKTQDYFFIIDMALWFWGHMWPKNVARFTEVVRYTVCSHGIQICVYIFYFIR